MPSDRRERSGSAGSAKSAASRASSSMGKDGGEVGRRMAAEDELIRRELQDPTTFCNSFWGSNDAGYPAIQSRMKSSAKIIEDVRLMYKERSEIEQEYAKRLAKLSKQQFGKDETGSMKHALEMVRGEIEQTAKTHADLSLVFKRDLEGQLGEFQNRIQSQRKTTLTNIEKLYKQKTTQESYVNKSKDKYEQDCIRINGYTAQSSLVQGRDLEKVTSKLDKAQSTVNGNDKDYQNFVRALKDTTLRWNSEWKSYLDQCQDLEEERLEFLKSNLWNYANSISAVCVADDQSCERVRVSLESCEAPRDIIDFIQRAGTGSAIPDPPDYINYSRGQPPPTRPTFKTAAFHRTSTRPPTFIAPIAPVMANPSSTAGGDTSAAMIQSDSRGDNLPASDMSGLTNDFSRQTISNDQDRQNNGRPPPGGVALPGMTNSQSITNANTAPLGDDSIGGDSSAAMRTNKSDKRMSAKNFLARTPSRGQSGMGNTKPGGGNANGGGSGGMQSMQSITSSSQRSGGMTNSDTSGTMGTTIIKPAPPLANERVDDDDGDDGNDDPIARALADLRNKPNRSPAPQQSYTQPPQPVGKQQPYGNLGGQRGVVNDYPTENRARSPSAAFMQEPERATSPLPVEEVVGQYGQSFPGERRTLSRQNSNTSRHSRMSMHAPQSVQQTHERSRSPGPQNDGAGFAGVGARGRSPSPQPFQQAPIQQQQVRSPQKQPAQASQQNQFAQKPPMQSRPSGQPKPNTFGTPQRSTTPLGISLDASGSVTYDQMADDFIRRTGSVGPQQGRAMTPQQPQQQPQQAYQASGLPPHMQQQQAAPVQGAYGHPSHPSQQSTYSAQQYSNVPPQSQQSTPVRQGYGGGAAGGPYTPVQGTPGGYQQTPPPGSLGRQGGTPFAGAAAAGGTPGYQSPSPYNQRPASATAPAVGIPPPDRQSTPAGQAYMQPQQQQPYQAPQQQMYAQQQVPPPPQAHQETPASAYMHQYQQQQQQHQPPQPQAPQGAPYGQQWQSQAPQGHNPIVPQGGQINGGVPTSQYSGGGVHQPVAQVANTGNPSNATAARPPTGQYSDAGKPILFYVKALYDYEAQLQEEFSFTAGDVIAVWETNADGWWQGELLDDARRRQNSNTFPSNFVSLLN